MSRAIVSYASGGFIPGQARLRAAIQGQCPLVSWTNDLPPGSPSHYEVPFAFKSWALRGAAEQGFTSLIWADACILPIRPVDTVFEQIERAGYFIMRNGWPNKMWTADSAYEDLGITREENEGIEHVVGGCYGFDLTHPVGEAIFNEQLRLAQTRAFCGPTWNRNHPTYGKNLGAGPCGDETVGGHRHDQTALSVIAARHGCKLTEPPNIFCYKGAETDKTVFIADGSYNQ